MNVVQGPARLVQQVMGVNLDTLDQAVDLWRASTNRYLDASETFVEELAQVDGITAFGAVHRHYAELIARSAMADVSAYAMAVSSAAIRSNDLWQHGWQTVMEFSGRQASRVESAVTRAATVVAEPLAPRTAQEQEIEDAFDDRLDRINGIGAGFLKQLHEAGITSITQIAELHLEDLQQEDHPLHTLQARIESGRWVDQAQALISGKLH